MLVSIADSFDSPDPGESEGRNARRGMLEDSIGRPVHMLEFGALDDMTEEEFLGYTPGDQ